MFKQVLPVAILSAFMVCGVRAQSPTAKFSRWSIGLAAGPAFPVGNFASKALNSNESGHAHTGPGAELVVMRRFTRHVALVLTAAAANNPIGTYTTLISQATGGVTIRSGPWKSVRFGVGLGYEHSLFRRLSFDVRATAGVLKTAVPGYSYQLPNYIDYTLVPATPLQIIYSSRGLPWSFVYAAGAELKWPLKGRFFLCANACFAAAHYDILYSYVDQFTGATSYRVNAVQHHQPIAVIQAGVGAGVRL